MSLTEFIKENWQFIVSIMAFAAGWWRVSMKLSNWKVLNDENIKDLNERMSKNEGRIEGLSPILVTLQTDMAIVKTSLKFIEGSVNQIAKQ